MDDINLLPETYLKDLKLNKFFYKIIAISAIIFFSIILIVVFIEVQIGNLEKKNINMNESIYNEKYALSDKLSDEYKEILKSIEELETIVNTVTMDSPIIQEKFNSIFRGLPEGVKAYEITINNKSIIFTGIADNKEDIVAYSEFINFIYNNLEISSLTTMEDGNSKFTFEWRLNND